MTGIDYAANGEGYRYNSSISNVTVAPNTTNGSHRIEETPECLLYTFLMYSVVCLALCVFGSIGNILSFIVFLKDSLKTSTSFLFQALALIDTAMLILVIPVYCIVPIMRYLNKHEAYFYAHQYVLVYVLPLVHTVQTATIWVTVLVGVNRYIAVCKPYQASRLCTVTQARKQLSLIIACALLYNIPRFFSAHLVPAVTANNVTVYEANHTTLGSNLMFNIIYNNILYVIVLLTLPILILTLLNIRLINALQEIKRRRAEMQNRQQQQDNNVTLVLIIVVIVFITCQLPALINQIMWNTLSNISRECGGLQYYFSKISNCLVIVNSSVNFVIYLLFNTRFKQVLLQLFCKQEHKPMRVASCNTANNHHHKEVDGTTQTLL